MQKTSAMSVLFVALVLVLGLITVQTAQAEEVVCGQWRLANCPFNGANTPVFQPCGSSKSWVPDPTGSYSLFQNGQFVRLYSPRVTYGEGFKCDGQDAGYLWTVARTEQISSCAACQPTQNNPPSGYIVCSSEGQRCNFAGTKDVAYGANGKFNYKYGVTGSVDCNNATFGDPISGVGKACYIKAAVPTPVPTPIPPPTPNVQVRFTGAITEPYAQVRNTGVNLRSGPGTNYPVVGSASAGTHLRITGKNSASDWWQVCCVGGQEAWVAAWVVDAIDPIWQVPVVAQPSPAPPAIAQGTCGDSYEPNDDQFRQLVPGQISATICPQGDKDQYQIDVQAGDSATIDLTNLPADYDLMVSGNAVPSRTSKNGGTLPEQITLQSTSNGYLRVMVWGYNGASSTWPYYLTIRVEGRHTMADDSHRVAWCDLNPWLYDFYGDPANQLKLAIPVGSAIRLVELLTEALDSVGLVLDIIKGAIDPVPDAVRIEYWDDNGYQSGYFQRIVKTTNGQDREGSFVEMSRDEFLKAIGYCLRPG